MEIKDKKIIVELGNKCREKGMMGMDGSLLLEQMTFYLENGTYDVELRKDSVIEKYKIKVSAGNVTTEEQQTNFTKLKIF